jgi:hypothetical protein
MASLAMTIVILRSLRNGYAFEATIVSALYWMCTLGFIGFMVASVARNTIDEAVRQQMEEELAAARNPVTARAAEASA